VLYIYQALICPIFANDNMEMKINQIDDSLALAELIKSAIAKSGLTKKSIAEELGVKPQAITGWERTGRIHRSTLRDLGKLVGENLTGDEAGVSDLHAETQAVIKMMEESELEGRILAKHAVSDALKKFKDHQNPIPINAIPNDLLEAMLSNTDESVYEMIRGVLESAGKLQQRKKYM
jgi:transcriptional regulator with XRE-family HTH domain